MGTRTRTETKKQTDNKTIQRRQRGTTLPNPTQLKLRAGQPAGGDRAGCLLRLWSRAKKTKACQRRWPRATSAPGEEARSRRVRGGARTDRKRHRGRLGVLRERECEHTSERQNGGPVGVREGGRRDRSGRTTTDVICTRNGLGSGEFFFRMSRKCCAKSAMRAATLSTQQRLQKTQKKPPTLGRMLDIVRPIPIRMHIVAYPHAIAQLLLEQVALVQKQHDRRLGEQLRRRDGLPEHVAVLEAVDAPVLREPLVEARDRREEEDRVAVVEVRVPGDPLRARPADVVDAPFGPRCGPWGCACAGNVSVSVSMPPTWLMDVARDAPFVNLILCSCTPSVRSRARTTSSSDGS